MVASKQQRRKRLDQRKSRAVLAAMPSSWSIDATVSWETEPEQWQLHAAGEESGPLPRFSILAYTGGLIRLGKFKHPIVLDLRGVQEAPTVPVLRDHKIERIVGHVDQLANDGRSLRAAGVVSGVGGDASEVIQASRNGFRWQASVGGQVEQAELIAAGRQVTVNGQTFDGPVIVARRFTLREISFVAVGANVGTSALVAASAANEEESEMKFQEWLQAAGWVEADLSEQQLTVLRAAYDAEQADDGGEQDEQQETATVQAAASGGVNLSESRNVQAAERERVRAIERMCSEADNPTIEASGQQVDLAAHAIRAGWTGERTELEIMRATRPSTPAIHSRSRQQPWQVVEAAMCMRVGVTDDVLQAGYSDQTLDQATTARARQAASLHALMHQVITAAGDYYQPGVVDDDFIRAAFRASSRLESMDIQASGGGVTTMSLPGILGNVANKSLLTAYQAVNTVWQLFCGTADHGNFHTHTRYRLTGTGQFVPLAPDGQLKHATLGEETYTNTVDTKGRILGLTRKDIINDDLGAFVQLAQILGRGGALALEEAFFKLVLGNAGNFFHANNNNLVTSNALSVDGLTAAVAAMDAFVDSHGKPVLVTGDRLLLPPALYVTGRQLYDETKVVGPSSAKTPASNPHAGSFTPHKSPYLSNSAIKDEDGSSLSGQSATTWYLFADPAVQAAFEVAFLQGRRTPTIESGEAHFNTLGMQWRGYWDFGVAQQNPRGAVKCTA